MEWDCGPTFHQHLPLPVGANILSDTRIGTWQDVTRNGAPAFTTMPLWRCRTLAAAVLTLAVVAAAAIVQAATPPPPRPYKPPSDADLLKSERSAAERVCRCNMQMPVWLQHSDLLCTFGRAKPEISLLCWL